jgi:hypothetical protein
MSTEAELQRQNERFELLLNLATSITSSLDIREVLRAIAANIREVIRADAVTVVLPDVASEKFRVFAIFRMEKRSSRKSCWLRQVRPLRKR